MHALLVSLGGYTFGLWQALAVATFPLMFVRQLVCLLILKVGCENIVSVDVERRIKESS